MPRRRGPRMRMRGVVGGATPAQGTLQLSSTALSLNIYEGASDVFPQDAFVLSNVGAGAWANPQVGIGLSAGSGWFSLQTTANANGSYTYVPVVDATSLTAGTYTATLTITDGRVTNSPQTVTVTVGVVVATPTILLTPSGISFTYPAEASTTTKTVVVSNTGQSTLATPTIGTISYSGDYTGFLAGNIAIVDNGDGTFDLQVTPSLAETTAGTATALVEVVSAGASNTPQTFTVDVTLTTNLTALLVIDRAIDDASATVGGANPSTENRTLTTGNAIALAGPTIQSSGYSGAHSGWATASIVNGTTYRVVYNIAAIVDAGVSYFDAVLADASAGNTVAHRTVLVMGGAAVPDQIILSPNVLTKNAATTDTGVRDYITVTNLSGNGVPALGTITAGFSPPVTWASAAYANGTITVDYTPSVLSSGQTVNGTLVVSASGASNSPQSVAVQLNTQQSVTEGYYPPVVTLPQTDDVGGVDGSWSSVTNDVTYTPFAQPSLGGYA